MRRNDDLSPAKTTGVIVVCMLFVVAFWVAVAIAVQAVR